MRYRFRISLICFLAALSGSIGGILRADIIRLKNGGEIRGQMDRGKSYDESKPLEIVSLSGIHLKIDRDDVDFYVFRSPRVEEYETLERDALDTPEDHWELAQWSARNHLETQERKHLLRLVELQPEHEKARKLLDHVKYQGTWMPREEMMSKQGYVKYKNGYITLQEMELINRKEQQQEISQEWFDQMKRWKTALYSPVAEKSETALEELQKLRDPEAIPALVHLFAHHEDNRARSLMIEILEMIDSSEAKEALALQAIFDEDPDLRLKAVEAIPERYHLQASQLFANHLEHADNKIVNRSARALLYVAKPEALNSLIDALATSHTFNIHVPVREGVTFASNGNNNRGLGSGTVPAEIEALARTGQLPYGFRVNPPLGMSNQAGVKWKPVTLRRTIKNSEVLATLVELTGENFGYDQRLWRLWMASRKNQGQSLFITDQAG